MTTTTEQVELLPEPTNEHEPNAIKVVLDGKHVGYIPAKDCLEVLDYINNGKIFDKVKRARGIVYYAYAPAVYTEHADGSVTCDREPLRKFLRSSDAKASLNEFNKRPTMKYNYTLEDVHRDWKASAHSDIGKAIQDNYNACWAQICTAAPDLINTRFREIVTSDMRAMLDFWMEQHEIQVKDKYGCKKIKKQGLCPCPA